MYKIERLTSVVDFARLQTNNERAWPNVFDVGPALYKCYTNVLCLLGRYWLLLPGRVIQSPRVGAQLIPACTRLLHIILQSQPAVSAYFKVSRYCLLASQSSILEWFKIDTVFGSLTRRRRQWMLQSFWCFCRKYQLSTSVGLSTDENELDGNLLAPLVELK